MAQPSKVGDIVYTPDGIPHKVVSIQEIVEYFEYTRQMKIAASMQRQEAAK